MRLPNCEVILNCNNERMNELIKQIMCCELSTATRGQQKATMNCQRLKWTRNWFRLRWKLNCAFNLTPRSNEILDYRVIARDTVFRDKKNWSYERLSGILQDKKFSRWWGQFSTTFYTKLRIMLIFVNGMYKLLMFSEMRLIWT